MLADNAVVYALAERLTRRYLKTSPRNYKSANNRVIYAFIKLYRLTIKL